MCMNFTEDVKPDKSLVTCKKLRLHEQSRKEPLASFTTMKCINKAAPRQEYSLLPSSSALRSYSYKKKRGVKQRGQPCTNVQQKRHKKRKKQQESWHCDPAREGRMTTFTSPYCF